MRKHEQTPSPETQSESKKNQGQKIIISAIKGESHWVETTYDNGGFEYKIQPIDLEARNREEIDRRVEAGEDRDEILEELANNYIQRHAKELDIDPEGYVSPLGRIYESLTDPKIKEIEPEE